MPENKTNPQDTVRQLQAYKKNNLNELLSKIAAQKNAAMTLRVSISGVVDKLNELAAEEAEKAALKEQQETKKATESKKKASKAQPEEIKAVQEEVKPEEAKAEEKQPAKETVATKVAEEEIKEKPAKEKKAPTEEVKPEETKSVEGKQKAEKSAEKKAEPEKKAPVVEEYLEPTDNPNIFIKHYADGSVQKIFKEQKQPKSNNGNVGKKDNNGKTTGWVRVDNQPSRQNGQRDGARPVKTGKPAQAEKGGYSAPDVVMPSKGGKQSSKGHVNNENQKRFDDKASANKHALFKKGYIIDETRMLMDDEDDPRWRSSGVKRQKQNKETAIRIEHAVITTNPVSIKVLSEKIGKSATEIIRTLFILGIQKTINESIDFETAELVTTELYGDNPITLEYKPIATFEEELKNKLKEQDSQDENKLESRPPIVTIMGHVDHGKTSLLDRIRKANVQSGEAGGITQHIGAYTVSLKGRPITFLDTPGHEAFTAMRARGAQGADVAVLVVAADDGVMPQTLESISHAKLANAHMIVACNKIDRAGANPDRVKNQLVEHDVLIEEWGGKVPFVKVSAKTGEGIEDLLENILTLSDYEILPKANPARPAHGVILEAKLDKALGKTATVLVQNGTLSTGDFIVAGTCTGKVRIMKDDKGRVVKKAGPSTPVVVTGWDDIPEAGDVLDAVDDEKFAKGLADERKVIEEAKALAKSGGAKSIDDLFSGSDANGLKTISLVIKADVQGSLEALKQSLGDLGNDEVEVKIVHGGVGAINESDISIADSAKAIVIGFNVRPDSIARASAAQKGVDVRFYDVIYNAIEEIENAVHGMLAPVYQENILGEAEVREIFKISGVGAIAGCHVTDGKIIRGAKARLFRNGKAIITTEIASLRHEKDDVKEIAKNFDCGIMLLNYQDIKVGDVIEAYEMEQVNG